MIINQGFNEDDFSVTDDVCLPALVEHEYLAKTHLPGPAILRTWWKMEKVWARLRARGTDPRTGRSVSLM
jgi:hypothetical protein